MNSEPLGYNDLESATLSTAPARHTLKIDSVPHKRLISKLQSYKFNPVIISWIKNYLQDRSQYVEINGEKSQWQPVTSGIPQGSVLGSLLFLIYINDLPKHVNSKIYMYADDTKIYREIREKNDQEILQKDLDSLKAWSDEWLLKFHPNKCYSITIGKKEDKDHTYHISDKGTKYNMAQINDMKDIGVIMDSDLKFEKHINSKIDTANKILGIIRRSFMYLSAEIFIPLYKAMVRSHFDYAMVIWNPLTVKCIESIEGVQRRATKTIDVPDLGIIMSKDCSFDSHISSLSRKCKNLAGWILRSFVSRDKLTMLTLFKSLVISRLDYASQLWSPHKISQITLIEKVQQSFTKHITGMRDLSYHERLQALRLYSLQRRRERYCIILI